MQIRLKYSADDSSSVEEKSQLLGQSTKLYHLLASDDPRGSIQAEADLKVGRLYPLDAPIIEKYCVCVCYHAIPMCAMVRV